MLRLVCPVCVECVLCGFCAFGVFLSFDIYILALNFEFFLAWFVVRSLFAQKFCAVSFVSLSSVASMSRDDGRRHGGSDQ